MYLEISSRRCGKTYRMLQHAARLIRKGKRVMFVCLTQHSIRQIQNYLHTHSIEHPGGGVVYFTTYRSFDVATRGLRLDQIYFDEFDYASWKKDTQKLLVHYGYIKIGYFVTTASFLRTVEYMRKHRNDEVGFDLLVYLVRLKHHKYHSYIRYVEAFPPKERSLDKFHHQTRELEGCWRTSYQHLGERDTPEVPKYQKIVDLPFLQY